MGRDKLQVLDSIGPTCTSRLYEKCVPFIQKGSLRHKPAKIQPENVPGRTFFANPSLPRENAFRAILSRTDRLIARVKQKWNGCF